MSELLRKLDLWPLAGEAPMEVAALVGEPAPIETLRGVDSGVAHGVLMAEVGVAEAEHRRAVPRGVPHAGTRLWPCSCTSISSSLN